MRALLLTALILIAVGIYPSSREYLKKLPNKSYIFLTDVAFTKDISVIGANFVTEEEVRNALPLTQSAFWWLVNPNEVVTTLRQNKYVASAKVEPCSEWILDKWGCFRVEIDEHEPKFLVNEGGKAWLAGSEGAYLKPISETDNEASLTEEFGDLTTISGLARADSSPDLVLARFQYVRNTIGIIEHAVGMGIKNAELSPNGELTVSFIETPIRARFAFAKDKWGELKEETVRLKTLLSEIKGREETIELIDLAYERLAVVKKKPEIETPK